MNASETFLGCIIVLFALNILYYFITPESLMLITVGGLLGFISQVIAVGILGGIQILGSGLNSQSIKILFGVTTLFNILFRIDLAGYPVGIGLLNNVFNIFSEGDFLGFGTLIVTTLGLLTIITGLMILTGGGE